MKRTAIITAIVLLLSFKIVAQPNPDLSELKVILYRNGIKEEKKLSELYKNKLLLLDFWATWCSPCLDAFPKMDSLQREFKDNLEIIAVTYQDEKTMLPFFKMMNRRTNFSFAFIINDTLLGNLFPYRLLPHVVWIDSLGKNFATTGSDAVTDENIASYLKGVKPNLFHKKDVVDFDRTKIFKVNESEIYFRSLLTKYQQGIGSGYIIEPWIENKNIQDFKRFFSFNVTIKDLFMFGAYGFSVIKNNNNYFHLEVKDSLRYLWPQEVGVNSLSNSKYSKIQEWKNENLYCFELILPQEIPDTLFFQQILKQLNEVLPVKAEFEMRVINHWKLINKTKKSHNLTSNGDSSAFIFKAPGHLHKAENKTIDQILQILPKYTLAAPIVNATTNKFPVDMELNLPAITFDISIEQIKAAFLKYGFDIVPHVGEYKVLVIKDKK